MSYADDNGELVRDKLWFDDGFTMLPNSWVRDKHLTNQALGLLARITSHKAGYKVSIASLAAGSPNGRDAVRTQINELMARGYLRRREFKVEGLKRYRYHLQDPHSPVDNAGQAKFDLSTGEGQNPRSRPSSDFQYAGNPSTGNPLTENPTPKEDYLSNKETSVNETPYVPPVDNAADGRSENDASGATHAGYALVAAPRCPLKPQRYRDRGHDFMPVAGYCLHCGAHESDFANPSTGEIT